MLNEYDCISPIDYRYWDKDVAEYLSEEAFIRYKMRVEIALVKTICWLKNLDEYAIATEVRKACLKVTAKDVYKEEQITKHDIRALVNCICRHVREEVRPLIHLGATSCDIVDTANALRYQEVVHDIVLPVLENLKEVLEQLALREADTVQIGRTHGQHAVPITFGFMIAGYVSRFRKSINKVGEAARKLVGKFSGAVGAYNALSLLCNDPVNFEYKVMENVSGCLLKSAEHSTQIAPPEPMIRLFSELTLAAGIIADLADDMRHLQRTEIGEIYEEFDSKQVGSSTMPHKRNPINFENAKSCWKIIVGKMTTLYMDQLSEHQRDLTNSASSRTYGEIICYLVSMTKRMSKTMAKVRVDKESLKRNLEKTNSIFLAEPLYIILADMGHPNAHEKVKQLTLQAEKERKSLQLVAKEDAEVKKYYAKMSERYRNVLDNPVQYTGIAAKRAKRIANNQ